MKKIFFIHPDPFFAAFIRQYLDVKGFETQFSVSNVDGFTTCVKFEPDLIILNKESPHLDAMGFLIKKRLTEKLRYVPAFVLGEFSPREIEEYKKVDVKAFLSGKINPLALLERIHHLFSIPLPEPSRRTPMLLDIHAKGKIIIVQIEGNLEAPKLVVLNYLIRSFCGKHRIRVPKLFIIIPSLYPESITAENMDLLFFFRTYPELTIVPEKIQILTQNKEFIRMYRQIPECAEYPAAKNYYDGFKALYADMDIETRVPVSFIKQGNQYILDLFDESGVVALPALQEVTAEFLESLGMRGVRTLKYYSDIALSDILESESTQPWATVFDYITRTSDPINPDLFDMNVLNDKQNLFFRNVKGRNILFISPDQQIVESLKQILGVYFNFERYEKGLNILKELDEKQYILVLIDLRFAPETVYKVIHAIRSVATRRRVSIILLAQRIDKADLMRYRDCGTDHVILAPFTSEKIHEKIFHAVSIDRTM